jgi:hypothetical protein
MAILLLISISLAFLLRGFFLGSNGGKGDVSNNFTESFRITEYIVIGTISNIFLAEGETKQYQVRRFMPTF